MVNSTISLSNNQEKNKISLLSAQQIIDNLLEKYHHDAVFVKVLNYLLLCFKRHKGRVFPCQQTIADYAQCSREHVNRIIKLLADLKLIYKKKIPYTSCSYWLHAIFFDVQFRWNYRHIFSALKWSALFERVAKKTHQMIAKARENAVKVRQRSQYYINYIYINNKNTFSSSSDSSKVKKSPEMYARYVPQPIVYEDPQELQAKIEQAYQEKPNIFLRILKQGFASGF